MASPEDLAIIEAIIAREGKRSNDPLDPGGLTIEGISERANPDLFKDGPPSPEQVRQRYEDRYIIGPGFAQLADYRLKSLLVDWGVNSGPAIAILALQRLLGVNADGVLGPATLAAVASKPASALVTGLVAERVKMIGRLVQRNPSQLKFLSGWLARALEFLHA